MFTKYIIKYLHPYNQQVTINKGVITKININTYHLKEIISFHKVQFTHRRQFTNHDIQNIIHQCNIDSFLFHHIIINTKPITSNKIINPHFDQVRLFSKNRLFPIFLNKSRIPFSYISSKHPYISSNILVNQS